MSRNALLTIGLVTSVTGGLTVSAVEAAPSISIGGLDGAEHWVWVEGEHASDGTGSILGSSQTNVSGGAYYHKGDPGSWIDDDDHVTWDFVAPAAMSENTKLYLRSTLGRDRPLDFFLDGELAVTEPIVAQESGSVPSSFLTMGAAGSSPGEAGLPLGAVTQGEHELRVEKGTEFSLQYWRFDGVLLYDGEPVLPGEPLVELGQNWLPNPSSANSPVIGEPITPTLDVTGLEVGNEVFYLLNGQAYTPGTEIGAGEHELAIYVLESSNLDSERVAFAGANFTVIPEPASAGLVLAGVGLCLLSRRRAQA